MMVPCVKIKEFIMCREGVMSHNSKSVRGAVNISPVAAPSLIDEHFHGVPH